MLKEHSTASPSLPSQAVGVSCLFVSCYITDVHRIRKFSQEGKHGKPEAELKHGEAQACHRSRASGGSEEHSKLVSFI